MLQFSCYENNTWQHYILCNIHVHGTNEKLFQILWEINKICKIKTAKKTKENRRPDC